MSWSSGGDGGHALCQAGTGGEAGDCCDPPGPGHHGGNGGPTAKATGGHGGDQSLLPGGDGGVAFAQGGFGGKGADGSIPGLGGSAGERGVAIAGQGGLGKPPGEDGTMEAKPGNDGAPGEPCPSVSQRDVYNGMLRELASGSYEARASITNVNDLYHWTHEQKAAPAQVSGPLGLPGQRMCVTLDGGRLFLAQSQSGIQVWNNPVAGVDATPDFSLTPDGPAHPEAAGQSCWLDEDGDILYGMFFETSPLSSHICGWRNASHLTANRAADFSFSLPSNKRGLHITGGSIHNVLFLSENIISEIYVIANPAGRSGAITPDHTITATRPNVGGIAYDDTRDLLYTFRNDPGPLKQHTIRVVTNAWQPDGAPTFHEFRCAELGRYHGAVIGLQAMADRDVLFVGNQEGKLLAFAHASALEGDVTPHVSYEPDDPLQNFAI